MTTTPLPPLPDEDVLIADGHDEYGYATYTKAHSTTQLQAYAQQARADLEAENANLRLELQSARDINLAVVNRQQAEIEALRKKLAQARQDEADAVRAADAVYEAQERAADAYRAGSSGY